jgi:hypothetical protein
MMFKLECFQSQTLPHPSLIFTGKTAAYQRELHSKGRLLILTKVKSERHRLNTPAYYGTEQITILKSFVIEARVPKTN